MYVDRVYSIPHHGLGGAGVDFYVPLPHCFQYGPGIEGCLGQRRIAVHGRDTQEVDARVVSTDEERVGVLGP